MVGKSSRQQQGDGVRIRMYGETDVGRVRSKNQDSYFFNSDHGIAICADGIGGRPTGEVASRTAVETIRKRFVEAKKLSSETASGFIIAAIDKANSAIQAVGERSPESQGMGTTVNVLLFLGEQMYIGHVGDSRSYLYYEDHLWQLTVDHSIEVYVQKGWFPQEVLQSASKPGALVRALGLTERCEADVYERRIKPGEIILTCSDGLSGMVPDHRIKEIIFQNRGQPELLPAKLVAEANRAGGKDNITVIVTEVLSA